MCDGVLSSPVQLESVVGTGPNFPSHMTDKIVWCRINYNPESTQVNNSLTISYLISVQNDHTNIMSQNVALSPGPTVA